jgi:glucokinase
MILAGDIGGTNTRVAFFEGAPGALKQVAIEVYPSREHSGPEEIAGIFLATRNQPIEAAAFGIAGPVRDGRSQTPNLPWVVESTHLAAALKLPAVTLLNDLEANAHGIAELKDADFVTLNIGASGAHGNRALISAGTGLGEAGLLSHPDGSYEPFPSEGGHCDFAPRNEFEADLLHFLTARFQHVSYERVLSGPGLFNIYQFLRDTGRNEEPSWLAERIATHDPSATVSQVGLEGKAEICVRALDVFVAIYGAEAGNLALKMMSLGGIFIGGGIAPKILPKLRDPAFLDAFTAKGRVSALLQGMPVRVITNDKTALLGAARVASLAAVRARGSGA